VFVHVNRVELKQKSALALAWFGSRLGVPILKAMVGGFGKTYSVVVYSLAWFVLISFPWIDDGTLPSWIPLVSLLSTLGLTFRNLMISSKSLITLLIIRRHFVVNLVFLSIWFILMCFVLKDERIALALFVGVCALFELLVDAQLSIPGESGRLSRKWEKMNLALMFAVLSVFMVFGQVHNPGLYLVFRPDLLGNGTINSDSAFIGF